MAAPLNNDFWKIAYKNGNIGRKSKFQEPEDLIAVFNEWLEVMKDKKWVKQDFIKSGERAGEIVELEIQTPLTLQGFCLFAGVNTTYFYDFIDGLKTMKDREKANEFSKIITHIRETITEQKLQGAMVGAFNPMIVARIEGLKEKQDITSGDQPINLAVNLNKEDIKKIADSLDSDY